MENIYIYQHFNWHTFAYDKSIVDPIVKKLDSIRNTNLHDSTIIALDIVQSASIEDEQYTLSAVLEQLNTNSTTDMAGMYNDVLNNYDKPLSELMILRWHMKLFNDSSHMDYEDIGTWRESEVCVGKYTAPSAIYVPYMIKQYIEWENSTDIHTLIKCAISHLYFLSIHGFVDGNGRISRAIIIYHLLRYNYGTLPYSISNQLMIYRSEYYKYLSLAQLCVIDVTTWIIWFLGIVELAMSF